GLQRPHLLLLLPDRGEDKDRHLAPRADAARHLDPVAIREKEVDDRRVGRLHRGGVERLLRVRGLDHLEARVLEDDAERPPDLHLVVADQDSSHRACAGATGSSGNSTTNVVPCPGRDSTETWPPFASTKPFTIARPRPAPACDGSSAPW